MTIFLARRVLAGDYGRVAKTQASCEKIGYLQLERRVPTDARSHREHHCSAHRSKGPCFEWAGWGVESHLHRQTPPRMWGSETQPHPLLRRCRCERWECIENRSSYASHGVIENRLERSAAWQPKARIRKFWGQERATGCSERAGRIALSGLASGMWVDRTDGRQHHR